MLVLSEGVLMMKRAILCQVALIGVMGCSAETASVSTSTDTQESVAVAPAQDDSAATVTFVSLKVPNMF